MSVLYIAEYAEIVVAPANQRGQMVMEPPIAEQTISISGSSAACTNPFNSATRFVRIHTDAICSIAFGAAPTATTGNKRLAANQTEYFGIPKGQSYKVAAITNT